MAHSALFSGCHPRAFRLIHRVYPGTLSRFARKIPRESPPALPACQMCGRDSTADTEYRAKGYVFRGEGCGGNNNFTFSGLSLAKKPSSTKSARDWRGNPRGLPGGTPQSPISGKAGNAPKNIKPPPAYSRVWQRAVPEATV
jgi:hypothetical protein